MYDGAVALNGDHNSNDDFRISYEFPPDRK